MNNPAPTRTKEARAAHERGWALTPLNGKRPVLDDWPALSRPTLEQVLEWASAYNVGVRTGALSGLFVVDEDTLKGGKVEPVPRTPTVETGGGGRHFYFRAPVPCPGNSAGKIGPHVDTRGEGGQVVYPGSVHPETGKAYRWALGLSPEEVPLADVPEWILDRLTTKKRSAPKRDGDGALSAYARAAIEAETRAVRSAPEGQRNSQLNTSAFALGQLVGGRVLARFEAEAALASAADLAALGDSEIRSTLRSGLDAGEREPRRPEPRAPRGEPVSADGPKAGKETAETPAPGLSRCFKSGRSGVFYCDPDPDTAPLLLCGPLEVVAATRDADGGSWGSLLRWHDGDGRAHEWAMPREALAGDGSEVRRSLLGGGLYTAPGRKARELLTAFLTCSNVDGRARCVSRIGWHHGADGRRVFVLPDATFGEAGAERVLLQTVGRFEHSFRERGSLEEWRARVAAPCAGNSRLVLAVSAAFAAPLLQGVGTEGGGLHLVGGSSIGKSTALHVAGSVWGGGGLGGFVRSWRSTDNGLEGTAALHSDVLLCLDELSELDGRTAGACAYLLANGSGKARAGRGGELRPPATWRVLFLSSGEVTLADKTREDGRRRVTAGQAVRVVDVPADAGAGRGLFEDLHGQDSGRAFADSLKDAAREHYGTAGREWLRLLVDGADDYAAAVKNTREQFRREHMKAEAAGQVARVADRFGLVAGAGELAAVLGLVPWPKGEAYTAAGVCFEAWLTERGGTGPQEVEAGIRAVLDYIGAHGAARFETFEGSERSVPNRAGFFRPNGAGTDYYLLPAAWREALAGHSPGLVAAAMAERGLLKTEDGKHSIRVRVPSIGRLRVYHVPAGAFEASESEEPSA